MGVKLSVAICVNLVVKNLPQINDNEYWRWESDNYNRSVDKTEKAIEKSDI